MCIRDSYESMLVWADARDGKKVPISLVFRKDTYKKGKNPLLLYGYGSYGSTNSAGFSSVRLSLLDRGFVYAIAHIRGSQYLGREWYEDGKMFNKKNTFWSKRLPSVSRGAENLTNCPRIFGSAIWQRHIHLKLISKTGLNLQPSFARKITKGSSPINFILSYGP